MQKKKIEKIKAYITLYMAWRQNAGWQKLDEF